VRSVVQRVARARVIVGGETVAAMGQGLLALVGVGREDGEVDADALARKLVALRVFDDEAGRMNRSLLDTGGTLGVVSQFTLHGDTRRGRRPSYGAVAAPGHAEPLVARVATTAQAAGVTTVTGRFGAHMEIELLADGPVTLWIDTRGD